MKPNRSAALALILGTLAAFTTMALHPTGGEALAVAAQGGRNVLATGVHVLAMLAQPLLLLGMWVLTRRLQARPSAAGIGFAAYALGLSAVLVAAALSGFVAVELAGAVAESEGADRHVALELLHYTGHLNQALATVYVMLTGMALVFWGWAMEREPRFPRALGLLGMLVGIAGAVGVASGHLRLGVHGFGLVVLAQGVWVLWVAAVLGWGKGEEEARTAPAS